jgi:hypothetical protein
MTNQIWVCIHGETHCADLSVLENRPIGWSMIPPEALPVEGRTVAGVLGGLGAERIPRRYPVAIANDQVTELQSAMSRIIQLGPYFDHAWLMLRAKTLVENSAAANWNVALLTRAQFRKLDWPLSPKHLALDNGRIVDCVVEISDEETAKQTLEQQGSRYDGFSPMVGRREIVLVTTPSTPYAKLLRNAHSYFCILHDCHRARFGDDYLTIRNLLLEEDYPDLHATFAVRPIFSHLVEEDRVVLDSTTHAAIGLPQGEPVGLIPTSGKAPQLRNKVFGNRHCVARVGRTAMIDIEKPVTRIPDEIIDLLDIRPNERISVEAVSVRNDYTITRITLRVLQWRERSPLLIARTNAGVPSFQELVGDEDFPTISLDLATRLRLGISPGTAVYLRPSVSSELARQFTSVSLALLATIVAAALLRSLELALAMAVLYIVLSIFVIARRMRQ